MTTCCKYSAGMLKEPVTFWRKSRTDDGAGGFTNDWVALAGSPTKAKVVAASGGERYASARVEAQVALKVTTRFFSDLKESDSVIIRGKRCNIRFINNVDFGNKWLEISVDQGVAV